MSNPHWRRRNRVYGLFERRRFDLARSELMDWLGEDPQSAEALRLMAHAFAAEDRFREGVEWARKAVGSDPESPESLAIYGRCLVGLGQVDRGIRVCEAAFALDPGLDDVCADLSRFERFLGRTEKAREWALRGLEINPESVEGMMALAEADSDLGSRDRARSIFESARKLDPINPRVMGRLGRLYLEEKRIGDARKILREALSLFPEDRGNQDLYLESLRGENPLYRHLFPWMQKSRRFVDSNPVENTVMVAIGTALVIGLPVAFERGRPFLIVTALVLVPIGLFLLLARPTLNLILLRASWTSLGRLERALSLVLPLALGWALCWGGSSIILGATHSFTIAGFTLGGGLFPLAGILSRSGREGILVPWIGLTSVIVLWMGIQVLEPLALGFLSVGFRVSAGLLSGLAAAAFVARSFEKDP